MKLKRILLVLLALALVPAQAGAEEMLYEIDEETGEVLFLSEPEEQIELDAFAQTALSEIDGQMNLLLVGIDARPGEATGRSDTMILVTLDARARTIKLTSFMRDLYVEIPGKSNNRLNAAYRFGGAELLCDTLEANFGIRPDCCVAVNFSMLADLVDQIGGIELTVESEYVMDRINAVIKNDNKVLKIDVGDGLLTSPGTQTLTGKQAQAYARWRYGSSDFKRTERQREVILKILDTLREDFSLMEVLRLAAANIDKVYTDMSLEDVLRLVPALFGLKLDAVEQLRVPVDGSYSSQTVSGMAVIVPSRQKNVAALAEFLTGGE